MMFMEDDFSIFFLVTEIIWTSQVFGPWLQNKRKEHDMKKTLIPEILRFAQSNVGDLLHEDGTPDTHAIKRSGQISDMLREKLSLEKALSV